MDLKQDVQELIEKFDQLLLRQRKNKNVEPLRNSLKANIFSLFFL